MALNIKPGDEPKPETPVIALSADRMCLEGPEGKHLPPLWVVLRHADELDRFYREPAAYLRDGVRFMSSWQLLRVTDDAGTVFSMGLLGLVRGNTGAGVVHAEAFELMRNKQLRPAAAAPQTEAGECSVKHMGPARGWCVIVGGLVRAENCPSEGAARARLNQELANLSLRR